MGNIVCDTILYLAKLGIKWGVSCLRLSCPTLLGWMHRKQDIPRFYFEIKSFKISIASGIDLFISAFCSGVNVWIT